ncbi:putative ATPase [Enterobacter sp. AG326]|uniref:AAA family ATPase n=1 Tax=Enterobacter sp. AG326 TaxID=2183902 RepID=UPI00105F21D0|nr:AAA family ATPase [Enterobacter sp. AG326]TDP12368.1 putative ATPase [Enterobacter sp. AG326]
MLNKIWIRGYRSVRKLTMPLGRINLVKGKNGCGKSNLYNAIHLLASAANGQLAHAICAEGGINQTIWAGGLRPGEHIDAPKRIILGMQAKEFGYELQIGMPTPPFSSYFAFDPEIKQEEAWLGERRSPSNLLLMRRNQAVKVLGIEGDRVNYAPGMLPHESVFGHLAEPERYPEISRLRHLINQWRFYHHFDITPGSLIRSPQPAIRTPVLSHDGGDLAAAFATIVEIGDIKLLHRILASAFPDAHFHVSNSQGGLEIMMTREGLRRPLHSRELSDGTLRLLCLTVALLSPRPAPLVVLNEPESSLHPDMLDALGQLIAEASRYSQLWVTTHSTELEKAIEAYAPCRHIPLQLIEGETCLHEPMRREWQFDED